MRRYRTGKTGRLYEYETDQYSELYQKIRDAYVASDWAYIVFVQIVIKFLQDKGQTVKSGGREMPYIKESSIGTAEGFRVSTITDKECVNVLTGISLPKKLFLDPKVRGYIQSRCDSESNPRAPHPVYGTSSFNEAYRKFENCINKAKGDTIGDAFKVYYKAKAISYRCGDAYRDRSTAEASGILSKSHGADPETLDRALDRALRRAIPGADATVAHYVNNSKKARTQPQAKDTLGMVKITFQGSRPSSTADFLNMHDLSELSFRMMGDGSVAVGYRVARGGSMLPAYMEMVKDGKVSARKFFDMPKTKNPKREVMFMSHVLGDGRLAAIIKTCRGAGLNIPENTLSALLDCAKGLKGK